MGRRVDGFGNKAVLTWDSLRLVAGTADRVCRLAVARVETKIEAEAKREGLRQADEQITKSVAENEADAKREVAGLMNKRQAREQSIAAAQKARVTNESAKRKAPEYGNWAGNPVPDSVVDDCASPPTLQTVYVATPPSRETMPLLCQPKAPTPPDKMDNGQLRLYLLDLPRRG